MKGLNRFIPSEILNKVREIRELSGPRIEPATEQDTSSELPQQNTIMTWIYILGEWLGYALLIGFITTLSLALGVLALAMSLKAFAGPFPFNIVFGIPALIFGLVVSFGPVCCVVWGAIFEELLEETRNIKNCPYLDYREKNDVLKKYNREITSFLRGE